MNSERIGKRIGGFLYVHMSALSALSADDQKKVHAASQIAGLSPENDFNVVKLGLNGSTRVGLLEYSDFENDPFPALRIACSVDLETKTATRRQFTHSANPPILHRKELLITDRHPGFGEYRALTEALEKAGLYAESRTIGHKRQWVERLEQAGFAVNGHQLKRVNQKAASDPPFEEAANGPVHRHKTAITRYSLSAPMQSLAKYGFLDGSRTVFDYGCGKGGDVQILRENGIDASGWDPHYRVEAPRKEASIVNLGFVLNVIEDPSERTAALTEAFDLARMLLSVAVIPAGKMQYGKEKARFGDGICTERNTFQKFFSQGDLREYLREVLAVEPVAVAPGVFFVFKDELEEQRFLENRSRSRSALDRLIRHIPKPTREEKLQAFYEQHQALLDETWGRWLSLGRKPALEEIEPIEEIKSLFGSLGRALTFLQRFHGDQALVEAARARTEDLSVYFALQQFERRKPYKTYPEQLRRDIRAFFGSYAKARDAARDLLFSAGQYETIQAACASAVDAGIGCLEAGRSLQLHVSQVEQLPAVLRIYVGCAGYLYGDIGNADLVKIHIASGKLTLMSFDDFEGAPLPRMTERIKLNFRRQTIEFFEYGDRYTPPYLYLKSRYIPETFPRYEEQLAFDRKLEALGLFDSEGYGPDPEEFEEGLRRYGLRHQGFRLRKANNTR